MANYNEISRRGLIKLNTDFDHANDNQLKDYFDACETDGKHYERIRPHEQIIERLDEVTGALEGRVDAVSKSMLERTNRVFDTLIDSISGEVSRCEAVLDEQEDDDAYPDDPEDEDDLDDDDNEDEQ